MATTNKDLFKILQSNKSLAEKFVKKSSDTHLRKALEKAEKSLQERLNYFIKLGVGDEFGAAHAEACLRQLREVLRPLTKNMKGLILSNGKELSEQSVAGTLKYMRAAEEKFRGIGAASALRLREAMIFDSVVSGTEASQLRRLASSGDPSAEVEGIHPGKFGILERYGMNVVEKFEDSLQQKVLARKPWDMVREDIVRDSPFLQEKDYGVAGRWAERVVRTESAYANQRSNWQTIGEIDEQLGDMCKILSASFDDRTASDSYAVHGQIRRQNEAFDSWYGSYMHPPNRPNDREIVIPHRISWPIPAELAWRSDGEILSRWLKEGRKGSPPARPNMTTIPLGQFGKTVAQPDQQGQSSQQASSEAPRPHSGMDIIRGFVRKLF
jgi:hypothetical protein